MHDLYDSEFVFGDFAFIGLEGSTSGPGFLKHTEKQSKKHLAKQMIAAKGKILVVLSHTPPYGTLDLGIRFANPQDGASHIGSEALRDFVEKTNPAVVICGHCHSQGKTMSNIGATKVVNIASHDSSGSTGNFALIEIGAAGEVQVQFYDTEDLIPPNSLLNVHGVGPSLESAFSQAGITTIDQLLEASDLYKIADSLSNTFCDNKPNKSQSKSFERRQAV